MTMMNQCMVKVHHPQAYQRDRVVDDLIDNEIPTQQLPLILVGHHQTLVENLLILDPVIIILDNDQHH